MRRVELELNKDQEILNQFFHTARYKFASMHLRPTDEVLEIGCGFGYGARLMSEYCKSIHAMDPYGPGIKYAQEYFKRGNLSFEECLFDDRVVLRAFQQPDVVVSMEVIEHLDQGEQVDFIENIIAMDPRLVIISTPRFTENRSENRKREHKHEFTPEEFQTFLEETDGFSDIQLFSQNDEIISRTNLATAWNMIAVCHR